ncbi:MAG: hypothetical protein J6T65_10945 [Clostridia bacterium]|nr:hypothetical protein [Clostridia bacterium]
MKKLLSLLLCLAMLLSVVAMVACDKTPDNPDATAKPEDVAKTYTYQTYSTSLGDNWNPHTWETSGDDAILGYLSSPLVDLSIKDSKNGVYQWVYEMATAITDVTKDHQDDLTKFNAVLPEGKEAADITEGYVWEIKLNPDCKWQNGVQINADTYIYSMKAMLDPKMRNYRSNLYWSGESALAGAGAYYNSGAPLYKCVAWTETGYDTDLNAAIEAGQLYISASSTNYELYSDSLSTLFSDYGSYCSDESNATIKDIANNENAFGYVKVTAENKDAIFSALADLLVNVFGVGEDALAGVYPEAFFFWDGQSFGDVVNFEEAVGLYKVDDYTIRYVCEVAIDEPQFFVACTSNWLVYEELYEAGKDTSGELVTTNYGTSMETTMSYGTYKIESFQEGKQIVFAQNENWYGFEKDDKGNLVSYTNFEVDGEKRQQYMTQKVVINVMTDDAAKLAFLSGQIDDWTPNADELTTYASSDQLYRVDETYSMCLFFNTNVDALKEMDNSKGNQNSIVLSNHAFRNAFSLAIDRAEWVTATAGYKPLFGFIGKLYFYDVWNDPTSNYRASDAAMAAICDLYGIQYGEGTPYATLKEAYDSVTGYNLTEAKALMKQACDELVAEGLYTAGEPIKIRLGWKKGALDSSDNQQVTLLQKYLNAAADGSGFGTFTLEAVGNINDRYGDVVKGEFCIGYGGWGGAAFYPFRNMRVYMDPDYTSIHEGACWDPKTYEFTFVIDGEEVTHTAQWWSNCLTGTGEYANRDNEFKLKLTAQLEEEFLKFYYRIPLANSTACSLLSFKVSYYTEDYNIMYGFGGLRLMNYNYSDAEWDAFVKQNNGELNYQ